MTEEVEFGQKIPNSRFLRCFCLECNTPMRTIAKELYNEHYCELCSPQIKTRGRSKTGKTGCTSPLETLEAGYAADVAKSVEERYEAANE